MMKRLFLVSLLLAVTLFFASPVHSASVETMNKDELKGMLGSENLVILDVRRGKDWSSSEFKIKNAVRVDKDPVSTAEKFPKDNTFVLYCA